MRERESEGDCNIIPDFEYLKTLRCGAYIIVKTKYPELYNIINNIKYSSYYPKTFAEKLYLYYNSMDEPPTCSVCQKNYCKFISLNLGYKDTCCSKCSMKNPDRINKIKQTKLNRYGKEGYNNREKSEQTCLEKYGVKNPFQTNDFAEKRISTCLEKYGVEHHLQNRDILVKQETTNLFRYGKKHYLETEEGKEKIKSKIQNSIRKREQTCIEKYGVASPMNLDTTKQKKNATCLEKYGVEHYTQTNDYKNIMTPEKEEQRMNHIYDSKKKNNSFSKSDIEEEFKKWLTDNNIKYIFQHKDDKYPFLCDFYFPDKGMYFEIQGTWTHGPHPFNPDNSDDVKLLENWKKKYSEGHKWYKNAINTWTVRDVKKRNVAIKNNIKLIESFSDELNTTIKNFQNNFYV